MMNKSYTAESIILIVLTAFPVYLLIVNLIALHIYGVDIPYKDDWRSLIEGDAASFSLDYIFKSANDTLSVTGQFLDSLSISLFSGHNVISQAISMVLILGGLFGLQFILLKEFTDNKLILGLSVLSIVFMLQPGSYWGLQTVAYNQAIPLLCILSILYIIIKNYFKNEKVRGLVICFISIVCGLSYISGAIAITAIAFWIITLYFFAPVSIKQLYKYSGIGLIIGSIITLPLQLRVILIVQSGKTHQVDAPWALPVDADFWLYILGKSARALGFYNNANIYLGFAISIFALLFSILCFIYFFTKIVNRTESDHRNWNLYCVYGSLFLTIVLYLFMVSAGRANLRSESISSSFEVFSFAQLRFHFFWVTLLVPWLSLIFGNIVTSIFSPKVAKFIIIAITILALMYLFRLGTVFNHWNYFKHTNIIKNDGLSCIKSKLVNNENIYCPNLIERDITEAVDLATKLNLSFTKKLSENITKTEKRVSKFLPVYRLNKNTKNLLTFVNAETSNDKQNSNEVSLVANNDPQVYLNSHGSGNENIFSLCRELQLRMSLETNHSDSIQLFYRTPDSKGFTEEESILHIYFPDKNNITLLQFEIPSSSGFIPLLRIDPGTQASRYKISNLNLDCIEH